jgi:hypothetical protein
MQYLFVTSFHPSAYDLYGGRMIESFVANTDDDMHLWVFTDTRLPEAPTHARVTFIVLDEYFPDQLAFEMRHNSPICRGKFGNFYDYRFDAVKFSHKPAALAAALKRMEEGDYRPETLVWLDADTVFKKPLVKSFLEDKFPSWAHVGHFQRDENHTEGGIIMFRTSNERVGAFLRIFWAAFDQDRVFLMPAWTDCHVFDILLAGAKQDGFLRPVNLGDEMSAATNHPIVNSEWFQYVDHLKGDRKENGASYESDIQVKV